MSTPHAMDRDPGPWYKQPWPWILMSFPLIAVIAGLITFYIAAHTDDGLVVDDYYKEGLAINEVLDRERKAKDLGLQAQMQWMPEGQVQLQLQTKTEELAPSQLVLSLVHPTRAGQDQTVKLERSGRTPSASTYSGKLPAGVAMGYWNLVLEDGAKTWRMEAKARIDTQHNSVSIVPL